MRDLSIDSDYDQCELSELGASHEANQVELTESGDLVDPENPWLTAIDNLFEEYHRTRDHGSDAAMLLQWAGLI